MNAQKKFLDSIEKNNSLVCVGLDPEMDKLPKHLHDGADPFFAFNKAIIDTTHDLVACYKPNITFYEAEGLNGLQSLKKTMDYVKSMYPNIPIIMDAKRADIGHTNNGTLSYVFDYFGADAITVNPYAGKQSLEPFLSRKDKVIIVWVKSSNPGADEFQDLIIEKEKVPLYHIIAKNIVHKWNEYNNCMLVVGATYPEEMKKLREIAPDMFFLVPGIGAQGGDLKSTLEHGLRTDKSGLIIASSRAIMYASAGTDFADKAREEVLKMQGAINQFR